MSCIVGFGLSAGNHRLSALIGILMVQKRKNNVANNKDLIINTQKSKMKKKKTARLKPLRAQTTTVKIFQKARLNHHRQTQLI